MEMVEISWENYVDVLTKIRKNSYLSQRGLEHMMQLEGYMGGTSPGQMSHYENGKVRPGVKVLFGWARGLGYDIYLVPRRTEQTELPGLPEEAEENNPMGDA